MLFLYVAIGFQAYSQNSGNFLVRKVGHKDILHDTNLICLQHHDYSFIWSGAIDVSINRSPTYFLLNTGITNLQEFPNVWIGSDSGLYIVEPNFISPGYSTFTILEKVNRQGIRNETPKQLIMQIEPPIWKTVWFILPVIALIAILIYGAFRYRLQQNLEIFSVRNRLHRDLHDDIGATLSSVKAYSEILRDNPDNPVIAELISTNSSEMLERLEVIAWATNPEHDNFKSLKSKMVKFASPLCHSKNVEFIIDSNNIHEEMVMSGDVRQNIFLIFKEVINNMIKYAEATRCNTDMSVSNKHFNLQISDNGKGFDGTVKGTGEGCKNIKKRTENLSGKLLIESSTGAGTVITMKLPYPFKNTKFMG